MAAEDDREALQNAAERGDVKAQYLLGLWYFSGQGGQKDYTKAAPWFHKAATQGDALSQYYIGLLYFTGQGVAEDKTKAAAWFGKAGKQGNARAQFYMGLLYNGGLGIPEDRAKAIAWFGKAAEQGDADAQYELGALYYNEKGSAQDNEKAAEWLKKAGEQGNKKAQDLYSKVIVTSLMNTPDFLVKTGAEAYQKGNYSKAAELFGKAAEMGNAYGQFLLGLLYADGNGVPQNKAKADELIRKAAAQGCKEAKDYLAKAGQELKKKKAEALSRFNAAKADTQLSTAVEYERMADEFRDIGKILKSLPDSSSVQAYINECETQCKQWEEKAQAKMLEETLSRFNIIKAKKVITIAEEYKNMAAEFRDIERTLKSLPDPSSVQAHIDECETLRLQWEEKAKAKTRSDERDRKFSGYMMSAFIGLCVGAGIMALTKATGIGVGAFSVMLLNIGIAFLANKICKSTAGGAFLGVIIGAAAFAIFFGIDAAMAAINSSSDIGIMALFGAIIGAINGGIVGAINRRE